MASANGVEKLSKSLYQAFEDYYTAVNGGQRPAGTAAAAKSGDNSKKSEPAAVADSVEEYAAESDAPATVEYRVQVLANDKAVSTSSRLFKGEKVSEYFDRGMYKYTVGHFRSQAEAEKSLRRLRKKFPQAFIIKMENGRRVD